MQVQSTWALSYCHGFGCFQHCSLQFPQPLAQPVLATSILLLMNVTFATPSRLTSPPLVVRSLFFPAVTSTPLWLIIPSPPPTSTLSIICHRKSSRQASKSLTQSNPPICPTKTGYLLHQISQVSPQAPLLPFSLVVHIFFHLTVPTIPVVNLLLALAWIPMVLILPSHRLHPLTSVPPMSLLSSS